MRVPSSDALIWNHPAPSRTLVPRLNCTVGNPTFAAASSKATPHGSFGGTSRSRTGPLRPCCSPGASLFSTRATSGNTSFAPQPVAPAAAQSSSVSAGGQNAIHELCDEQPPSTFARACRMKLLPRSCGSIG
ncbi:hypothetical protein MLGJGCBP_02214 [Rhodococcus sp. T7]|nr:hypothetical protein MLGJGCBP_02214 [Rhodococcus sp. T7]